MGTFPVLSILTAALSIIAMFLGLGILAVPLFLAVLCLAAVGFWKPGNEAPANGRVLAFFAILIAFLPFLRPWIVDLAVARREAIRATETAPLYERFEESAATAAEALLAFHAEHGLFPAIDRSGRLPVFDADGHRRTDLLERVPAMPSDPFAEGDNLRAYPVGDWGVLLASAGQNAIHELPPPSATLSIDAQPNDPLAPFAWTGVDWRLLTYDPTNGAIGQGDLLHWVPAREGIEYNEAFERLHRAWDRVHALTPQPPRGANPDEYPRPEDDARTAAEMLEDEEWLASLAAASRAALNRRPHPEFWRNDPNLVRADLIRAQALYQLGHYRTGADYANDFGLVDGRNAEAFYWMGLMYHLGGDNANARRALSAASQIDPNSPYAARAASALDALASQRSPDLPRPWIRDNPPGP